MTHPCLVRCMTAQQQPVPRDLNTDDSLYVCLHLQGISTFIYTFHFTMLQ